MRLPFLLATLIAVGCCTPADAQGGWTSTPDLLTANYFVPAPPRSASYTDPVAIRSSQQNLYFYPGYGVFYSDMRVRVNGGSWIILWDEDEGFTEGPMHWESLPTTPGEYDIELRYSRSDLYNEFFDYRLLVVPPAQQAFSDGIGNSMVLWEGTTSALDSPLLVVEGIDADNANFESHYYAIGSQLFGVGRSRGADVLVLNFGNGGQDLRLNAEVVKRAIQYLNQIKTGSRKLDVAGVSMGGVVARYTLADMEADGATHDVGYFVSIDAPQQGAVLDAELLDWLYYSHQNLPDDVPVPANVESTAGKQLLKYNTFDRSVPTLHEQFYSELNALNGDGYPHLTEENIGVSFGKAPGNPPQGNPQTGDEWLEFLAPAYPNAHFDIESGAPEAEAGSLLPDDITNIAGRITLFSLDLSYEADRKAHPTFIPYDSALDRVNGQSKFDAPVIDAIVNPKFHDEVPPEIVEPLLERLGYPEPPPPPVVADISGPWGLARFETGTWTASATGGVPGYYYKWAHRALPEDPSACDAPPPDPDPDPDPPPCNPTKGGACTMGGGGTVIPMGPTLCPEFGPDVSGLTFSRSFDINGLYQIRLTVRDSAGDEDMDYKTVEVGWDGFARGGDPGTAATGSEAAGPTASARADARSATGVPEAVALEAYPNPVGASAGSGRTAMRFGLPAAADVALVVYDVLGREVARLAEGERAAGWHEARFEASGLPSGRYVVRLTAGSVVETIPMTVLR